MRGLASLGKALESRYSVLFHSQGGEKEDRGGYLGTPKRAGLELPPKDYRHYSNGGCPEFIPFP